MKITISINSKVSQSLLVPFFKAKKTYLQPNWGNASFLELSVTSIDDEYIDKLGETTSISEFLMDCVHYDLCVISINGEPLRNKEGYEIQINPFSEEYYLPVNSGYNHFEIELVMVDGVYCNRKGKTKKKLLIS